jgi:hypothetical protein
MTRYAPGAPVPSYQPGYGGKPQAGAAYGAAPYNNGGKGGDMGKPPAPMPQPQAPYNNGGKGGDRGKPMAPVAQPYNTGGKDPFGGMDPARPFMPQQQPANPYGQFQPGMEARPGNRMDPRFAQWQAMMRQRQMRQQQPQQPQPVIDYFNPNPRP